VAEPNPVEWVLVFTTRRGTPVDPDNFIHNFHCLCTLADPRHWMPRELRHSAESIMLAQGAQLRVVSEALGRATTVNTKDNYGHLIGDEKRETTGAITDVLIVARCRSPRKSRSVIAECALKVGMLRNG